jgi:hypothetical protein
MNGTHDNGAYYCAGESLNTLVSRFLQLLPRAHRVPCHVAHPGPAAAIESAAYQVWKRTYRQLFFTRFGFSVPNPLPQTVACQAGARTVVEDCVP